MNDPVAGDGRQGPLGQVGRTLLGVASAAAFFLAIQVMPYALAAFASFGSGAAWDWAIPPVGTLPLLLIALTLTAGRGAYKGYGRGSAWVALLVLANLAVLAWFWG